jgi:hypothetical protein
LPKIILLTVCLLILLAEDITNIMDVANHSFLSMEVERMTLAGFVSSGIWSMSSTWTSTRPTLTKVTHLNAAPCFFIVSATANATNISVGTTIIAHGACFQFIQLKLRCLILLALTPMQHSMIYWNLSSLNCQFSRVLLCEENSDENSAVLSLNSTIGPLCSLVL